MNGPGKPLVRGANRDKILAAENKANNPTRAAIGAARASATDPRNFNKKDEHGSYVGSTEDLEDELTFPREDTPLRRASAGTMRIGSGAVPKVFKNSAGEQINNIEPAAETAISDEWGGRDISDMSFSSMPLLSKSAMRATRAWRKVPDDVKDEEALAQGLISPELLELIMTIVQSLMQGCLSNKPHMAWNRIKGYLDSKEMDRIGDNVRFNWMIDRWLGRLGIPLDDGIVVDIRRSLVTTVASMSQEDFRSLQIEVLFLTI